jgi:hypothetical protein
VDAAEFKIPLDEMPENSINVISGVPIPGKK